MSRTVWIDLTDIEKWTGQHGGTQRVVYGIAEEYYLKKLENKLQVKFFVFDESSKRFYETSFEPIRQRVEQAGAAPQVANTGHTKKQVIKQRLIRYTPRMLRENVPLKHFVKYVGNRSIANTHSVYKRIKRHKPLTAARMNEVSWDNNSTVLLLGKPWDMPDFTPAIIRLKLKYSFRLTAVIYDLVIPLYPHLHSPQLFKNYTQYMLEIARGADILLPISKSTEKDLFTFCKKLSIPKPKTRVIRLGDNLSVSENPSAPVQDIQKEFILCVGTIEIRKNHTLLYYVYKLAAERGIRLPQLVIVGRPGWLAGDIYYLLKTDPSIGNKILVLENVSDNGLEWLYQNCKLGVYPSFYEGWGLPVAESALHNKLVLASHASSIPEIAGDLMEYSSPYDSNEMLEKLIKCLDNNYLATKEKMLKKNFNRSEWSDTAKHILSLD